MRKFHFLFAVLPLIFFLQCSQDSTGLQVSDDTEVIKKYVEIYNFSGSYIDAGIYKVKVTDSNDPIAPVSAQGLLFNYTLSLANSNVVDIEDSIFSQYDMGFYFPGFDLALKSMKKGEKSKFLIPSAQAYGSNSIAINGYTIPSNAVLLMEINLIDIVPNDSILDYYLNLKNIKAEKIDTGFYCKIFSYGSSKLSPVEDDMVTAELNGYFLNGQYFLTNQTISYTIDDINDANTNDLEDNLMPGIKKGISKMQEGDEALLIFNSDYGYGSTGSDAYNIPPYADLVLKIKLTNVEK